MKTTLCFILTLLTFVTLAYVPNSFAQDNSPEYVVRVIYFIPKDRVPDPDMDTKLNTKIKEAQQFFADQMEAHGFDRKTFRIETDDAGNAIVHHVNGQHDDAFYQNATTGSWIVWNEIGAQFDMAKIIYLLALDISSVTLDGGDTVVGRASGNSLSGRVLVPASALGATIHELGHAFGLLHDYRFKAKRIFTSTLQDWMTTSFCAAKWLDAHRYFNSNQKDFNENSDVQLHPPSLAKLPYNIRLRFTLTDPDGLHQAQLFLPRGTDVTLAACHSLSGKNATVEFLTDELIGVGSIGLRVMDKHGNFKWHSFTIDITDLLPQEQDVEISIPDPNLASEVRKILSVPSSVAITRFDILKLKFVHFTNGQITNLIGLEHAINLQELVLHEQQVQDITPLAKLSNLNFLHLDGNPINNIAPLAGLPNLMTLSLRRSQISDITPLAGIKTLEILSLSENKINDITTLAELTNLRRLDIGSNQISDISPLAGLTNLQRLDIGSNQISDISPLAGLTNLEELYLYLNKIKDIRPLRDMVNLRVLNLWRNQIDDITPLAELTNLSFLDIKSNQINDITPLAGLTNLDGLHISGNPISDISLITKFTQLKSLSLEGIAITNTNFLTELTELEILRLPNCQISEIGQIARLTQLQFLDLRDNQISDVRPIATMINLNELHLQGNPIKNKKPLLALLTKNPDVRIYLKDYRTPLPVTLSRFRADRIETGVILKWTTESEIDNAGFNILRSETKDGIFKVVNSKLIQGAGTTGKRNEYIWTDTTTKPNTVYYYQIEDVSHAGVREQLATVRLRGLVSARGKLTTIWADLKAKN